MLYRIPRSHNLYQRNLIQAHIQSVIPKCVDACLSNVGWLDDGEIHDQDYVYVMTDTKCLTAIQRVLVLFLGSTTVSGSTLGSRTDINSSHLPLPLLPRRR